MAQDMTEKELLKMELDQLKKEVKNERQMVSIAPKCKMGSNLGTLRMLMGHTTAKGSSMVPSPRGSHGFVGKRSAREQLCSDCLFP